MQQEYAGIGSIKKIDTILNALVPTRIFLVTGGESFVRSGAAVEIESLLEGFEVVRFSVSRGVVTLPEVERGVALFRDKMPDIVIAVGGGSVIDTAKNINALAVNSGDAQAFVTGKQKIEHKGKPLVAIPTTAGSGSEATHFAVLYIGNIKYSLEHPFILPDYAIVDPSLTYSLSPKQTAVSGMDALCQAVESYWSLKATAESRSYAREAASLALKNLCNATLAPDPAPREAMSRAAHLAGKAINISKTTASHAMSYPLTARFGVPHGHAVALTLPELIKFNQSAETAELLGVKTPEEAADVLTNLMKKIGLATSLSELGITEKDIQTLVTEMSVERANNNPRPFTAKDADVILRRIL